MKEKIGKTSKSLKIFENDCLQNPLLLFMSLLKADFLKKAVLYMLDFTLPF